MGSWGSWIGREFMKLIGREGVPAFVRSHDRHLVDEYRATYDCAPDLHDMEVMRCGARGIIKGTTSL